MEEKMGLLLRWGVMVACAVMLLGGALYLPVHGGERADFRTFKGEPAGERSVAGIIRGAAAGESTAIIQLGCLLMIATPVVRVIFAAWEFCTAKDWLYTGISLLVLGLLLFGLFGSA